MDYHKIVPDRECSTNNVRVEEKYLFNPLGYTVQCAVTDEVIIYVMLFHVCGVVCLFTLSGCFMFVVFTALDKSSLTARMWFGVSVYIFKCERINIIYFFHL